MDSTRLNIETSALIISFGEGLFELQFPSLSAMYECRTRTNMSGYNSLFCVFSNGFGIWYLMPLPFKESAKTDIRIILCTCLALPSNFSGHLEILYSHSSSYDHNISIAETFYHEAVSYLSQPRHHFIDHVVHVIRIILLTNPITQFFEHFLISVALEYTSVSEITKKHIYNVWRAMEGFI